MPSAPTRRRGRSGEKIPDRGEMHAARVHVGRAGCVEIDSEVLFAARYASRGCPGSRTLISPVAFGHAPGHEFRRRRGHGGTRPVTNWGITVDRAVRAVVIGGRRTLRDTGLPRLLTARFTVRIRAPEPISDLKSPLSHCLRP